MTHIAAKRKCLLFRAVRCDLCLGNCKFLSTPLRMTQTVFENLVIFGCYNTDRWKRKHIDTAGYTSMRKIFFAMSGAVFANYECCSLSMFSSLIAPRKTRTPDDVRNIVTVNICQQSIFSYLLAKIWELSILPYFILNIWQHNMESSLTVKTYDSRTSSVTIGLKKYGSIFPVLRNCRL